MKRPTILAEVKRIVDNSETGSVFVPTDFVSLSDKKIIGNSLSRLEEEKVIRRIMRGVYYKAEFNEFLQEYVSPLPDKVAHALARNFGWTIVPCGDSALNLLGLSNQIPAAWVYVSDGIYKEYSYENTTIKFKRTSNKEISKLSYKTALVVQALKALGKDNVSDDIIDKLRGALTDKERYALLAESKTVTSWIYEDIKLICKVDIKSK